MSFEPNSDHLIATTAHQPEELFWNENHLLLAHPRSNFKYLILTTSLVLNHFTQQIIHQEKQQIVIRFTPQNNTQYFQSEKKQLKCLALAINVMQKNSYHLIDEKQTFEQKSEPTNNLNNSITSCMSQKCEEMIEGNLSEKQGMQVNKQSISTSGTQQKSNKYTIFVTKFYKEIEVQNKENLFHEYCWQEEEIEYIISKIKIGYGEFQGIIQKRNHLIFTFQKGFHHSLFPGRYHYLRRDFLVKKHNVLEKEGKIVYYVISKHELVGQPTHKIFNLPKVDSIVDMVLVDPWVVIAAEDYLIFLHTYNPMDNFQLEKNVYPTKIVVLFPNQINRSKRVITLFQCDKIILYELLETSVQKISTLDISFVKPYCLELLPSGAILLAGIDNEKEGIISNATRISKRREVFVVDKFFSESHRVKAKQIKYDDKILIMQIPSENLLKHPITEIVYIEEQNVFLCCWRHLIFVFDFATKQKLIEVTLQNTITKCHLLPYPFNSFNVLILTQNKQVIRVGFDYYGQQIGTELNKLKIEAVTDFCVRQNHQKTRLNLIASQKSRIFQYDMVKEVEVEEVEKLSDNSRAIWKMQIDSKGIAYLIQLPHSIDVQYCQF